MFTFNRYSLLKFLAYQQRNALDDIVMNFHLDGGFECYADNQKYCNEIRIYMKLLDAQTNIHIVQMLNWGELPKYLAKGYYHNLDI